MNQAQHSPAHEETWLLLPWLVNGRLSGSQRERAEQHVRVCADCSDELATQRRLATVLASPDRVTYAPGPSYRKLLDRLDAAGPAQPVDEIPAMRSRGARTGHAALWRPPGLAWAASFLVMFALTALLATAYRWSEPRFITRTDPAVQMHPGVLHVVFDRRLTIGEVQELLQVSGARVVEGPDAVGNFGIAPAGPSAVGAAHSGDANRPLVELANRLRSDPRVRWVEPIDATNSSGSDDSSDITRRH
jgi:hypothetical protein